MGRNAIRRFPNNVNTFFRLPRDLQIQVLRLISPKQAHFLTKSRDFRTLPPVMQRRVERFAYRYSSQLVGHRRHLRAMAQRRQFSGRTAGFILPLQDQSRYGTGYGSRIRREPFSDRSWAIQQAALRIQRQLNKEISQYNRDLPSNKKRKR